MEESHRDRLSRLPEDVIHHILSFLPDSKHRARTAVLSSAWRHRWAHHHRINLHNPYQSDEYFSVGEARTAAYIRAVDRCLESYLAPRLQSLQLRIQWPLHNSSLIDTGPPVDLSGFPGRLPLGPVRRVAKLKLSGECFCMAEVPTSVFDCSTLSNINLHCCVFPDIPPGGFRGFPNLKHLHLATAFISHEALDAILSTSPRLEKLCLDFVELSSLWTRPLSICPQNHPNIRVIKVEHMTLDDFPQLPINIDAPSLENLSIYGDLKRLSLAGARLLKQAYLPGARDEEFDNRRDWLRLMLAISQAEDLYVGGWFFQFIHTRSPSKEMDAMFKNLKKLHFRVKLVTEPFLLALDSIIKECPFLLYLSLEIHEKEGQSS